MISVPLNYHDINEWVKKIAQAINELNKGKSNNTGTFTLTASTTTTTVTALNVGNDSHISYTPTTANASAEIGNGTIYVSAKTPGASFTVTHANNAQVDRTFTYSVTG